MKKEKLIAIIGISIITSGIGGFTLSEVINKTEHSVKVEENSNIKKNDDKEINSSKIKDGTYIGNAKGDRGEVNVEVELEKGKIKNIKISPHSKTKNFFGRGLFIVDAK